MTTQAAFFLIADDRAVAAPWRDRILTMFSLIQQHARRHQADEPSGRYAEAAEKAFTNLPGLASSQRRIASLEHDSIASGIRHLLLSAPASQVERQLAFLTRPATLGAADHAACNEDGGFTDARSWAFYIGCVPRVTRDAQATPTLWIAFADWEAVGASVGDERMDREHAVHGAGDARATTPPEKPIEPTPTHVSRDGTAGACGRLDTRVLEATLHDTFFERYADRWAKFVANAPAALIRDDPRFLLLPIKSQLAV